MDSGELAKACGPLEQVSPVPETKSALLHLQRHYTLNIHFFRLSCLYYLGFENLLQSHFPLEFGHPRVYESRCGVWGSGTNCHRSKVTVAEKTSYVKEAVVSAFRKNEAKKSCGTELTYFK